MHELRIFLLPNKSTNVQAVDVYLQKRKTREYVGQLTRVNSLFIFTYDDTYIYKDRSIPLGPELPISKKRHTSKILFPSFEDRIPSKKNPAYREYCKMVGINPNEKDPLILLATLGQKGPSSFIFSPASQEGINSQDIIDYRKKLHLTIREFSELFDFSVSTIYRIENNKTTGKDALKRLELYLKFPEIALYEIKKNAFKINDEKRKHVENILAGTAVSG
jgi:HipA-like protein